MKETKHHNFHRNIVNLFQIHSCCFGIKSDKSITTNIDFINKRNPNISKED